MPDMPSGYCQCSCGHYFRKNDHIKHLEGKNGLYSYNYKKYGANNRLQWMPTCHKESCTLEKKFKKSRGDIYKNLEIEALAKLKAPAKKSKKRRLGSHAIELEGMHTNIIYISAASAFMLIASAVIFRYVCN